MKKIIDRKVLGKIFLVLFFLLILKLVFLFDPKSNADIVPPELPPVYKPIPTPFFEFKK